MLKREAFLYFFQENDAEHAAMMKIEKEKKL